MTKVAKSLLAPGCSPQVPAGSFSSDPAGTTASAYKLIADFERLGILREITGSRWGRQYEFEEYFRVFE